MLRPRRHKNQISSSEPGHEDRAEDACGLRLVHRGNSGGQRPTRSSPIAWNIVVATHRREKATEGLLMGCAVAEALSLSRNGLHPRVGLKLFGRSPLQFQFQPGMGVTSHRTHQLLMTFQAMLQSKSNPSIFSSNLRKRIAWYQRAFPFRHACIHVGRIVSRIRRKQFDDSMSFGLADDPLVRSLVIGVMLQGCVDSGMHWFQQSVGISHSDTRVLHASMLVGYAVQLAQMVDQSDFIPAEILDRLIDATDEPELKALLLEMRESLAKNQTLASVARKQGWENGIPSNIFAASVIGIYAWLRHPHRFRHCVERTIVLGGACSGAAVIAGSLSGISLGKKGIPPEWLRKVSIYPHGSQWQEQLIERVKDWPHGVDDIHETLALPSSIFGQISRNVSFTVFRLLHGLIRFPMRLAQFSVQRRKSKVNAR